MMDYLAEELLFMVGILLSIVLGFAIGYERKMRSKDAGIGTHTIVCMASALMVIVSKYGFGGEADAARVAAQIVSGISFLGAGIIVYRKQEIQGLTTAAGIWATAGIGMACGAGLYIVAIISAVLLILVHVLYHSRLKIFQNKKYYRLKIVYTQSGDESKKIKELFAIQHFHELSIDRSNGASICSAVMLTDTDYSVEYLHKIMEDNPCIISMQRENG